MSNHIPSKHEGKVQDVLDSDYLLLGIRSYSGMI